MAFTADKKTWYLTCMGSINVIVGDAEMDKVKQVIAADGKDTFISYPHGIGQHYQIELQTDESGEKVTDITWQKQVVPGSYVNLTGVYCHGKFVLPPS